MLLYLNLGSGEIVIMLLLLVIVIAVANYGRETAFGYWGSLLLCIFANPLVAFFVIYFVKKKYHSTDEYI